MLVKIISVLLYGALGGILFTALAALMVAGGAEPCPVINCFATGAFALGAARVWYFATRRTGDDL